MYRLLSVFFLSLCGIGLAGELKKIPEFLHICRRNEPQLQKCFKKSVLALKPYLVEGVPEHNIPRVEPLILKELLVAEPTGSGGQGVKISANNLKVYGCSNFDVRNLNIDFDKNYINFDVLLKHLYVDGEYSIDGRLILFPVTGSGKVTGNFTNCIGVCKMDAQLVTKDGKEYVSVTSMSLKIKVGQGSVHLFNLFGGEGILGDVINNVINQNFDTFSKELFPALERELSRLFLTLTNSILTQYTYAQLFPDN